MGGEWAQSLEWSSGGLRKLGAHFLGKVGGKRGRSQPGGGGNPQKAGFSGAKVELGKNKKSSKEGGSGGPGSLGKGKGGGEKTWGKRAGAGKKPERRGKRGKRGAPKRGGGF